MSTCSSIQPVAYGGGLLLFEDLSDVLQLELVGARTFDAVLHIYLPTGASGGDTLGR